MWSDYRRFWRILRRVIAWRITSLSSVKAFRNQNIAVAVPSTVGMNGATVANYLNVSQIFLREEALARVAEIPVGNLDHARQ